MKSILTFFTSVALLFSGHTTTPANTTPVPQVNVATTTEIQYGVQTKTQHCIANQILPDRACSVGAILTTDIKTICTVGYTKTVRNVPLAERKQVFAEYDIPYASSSNYEVDHIISLELGGSNDISNLYPESYLIADGARTKDVLENYLHKKVCDGSITVQEAQKEISTDWLKWFNYYGLAANTSKQSPVPTSTPTKTAPSVPVVVPVVNTQTQTTVPSATNASNPEVKKSTTGICHEKGDRYYDKTTNYTPYTSMDACVASGGRASK